MSRKAMVESQAYFEFRQRFFIVANICILFCCTFLCQNFLSPVRGRNAILQFSDRHSNKCQNCQVHVAGNGPKLASLAGVVEVIDALANIMGKERKGLNGIPLMLRDSQGLLRFVRALCCINSLVISMKEPGSTRQFDTPHK